MNILCKLFGHKIDRPSSKYFTILSEAIDGLGRHHLGLQSECDRCREKFFVGNVHASITKYPKDENKERDH